MTLVQDILEAAARFFADPGIPSLEAARSLLERLEPAAVIERAEALRYIPGCRERSERNPMLTKLCLAYDSTCDTELRLNFYHCDAYSHDSWHDHRWDFTSRVLWGSVIHLISSNDQGLGPDCMGTTHAMGDVFYVGRHLFHSFIPTPGSVTLMARGPYRKNLWTRTEVGRTEIRTSDELVKQTVVLTDSELKQVVQALRNRLQLPRRA